MNPFFFSFLLVHLIRFISFFHYFAERTTTFASQLSTSTCTPHQTLLGSEPLEEARLHGHRFCSREIRRMHQGRPSADSPFRISQPERHSWTIERLCIHEFICNYTCLTLFYQTNNCNLYLIIKAFWFSKRFSKLQLAYMLMCSYQMCYRMFNIIMNGLLVAFHVCT